MPQIELPGNKRNNEKAFRNVSQPLQLSLSSFHFSDKNTPLSGGALGGARRARSRRRRYSQDSGWAAFPSAVYYVYPVYTSCTELL